MTNAVTNFLAHRDHGVVAYTLDRLLIEGLEVLTQYQDMIDAIPELEDIHIQFAQGIARNFYILERDGYVVRHFNATPANPVVDYKLPWIDGVLFTYFNKLPSKRGRREPTIENARMINQTLANLAIASAKRPDEFIRAHLLECIDRLIIVNSWITDGCVHDLVHIGRPLKWFEKLANAVLNHPLNTYGKKSNE